MLPLVIEIHAPLPAMPAPHRTPFASTRFRIEIEGLEGTGAVEVILPEARLMRAPRHHASTHYGTLVLRRGLTHSSEWYDWWSGPPGTTRARSRAVRVVLLDERGSDAIAWTCRGATPVAYSVSSLNALGEEPVVESLELSVGGFDASFGAAPAKRRRRAS